MSKRPATAAKRAYSQAPDLEILISPKNERTSSFGKKALRVFRSGVNDALRTASDRRVQVTVKTGNVYIRGVPAKKSLIIRAQKLGSRRP